MSREPITNISYALFWLDHCRESILENPERGLHHWTHPNYSGGITGWEDYMNNVYFHPKTLEERMLQGEVHQVLVFALFWFLKKADSEHKSGTKWSFFDSMDIAEAYRIVHMISHVDPSFSCAVKVYLNKICLRIGETLESLANKNFNVFMGESGIKW